MSKYDGWRKFLTTLGTPEVVVTFQQLDKMAPLPKTAQTELEWWANEGPGGDRSPQAQAWSDAGYSGFRTSRTAAI